MKKTIIFIFSILNLCFFTTASLAAVQNCPEINPGTTCPQPSNGYKIVADATRCKHWKIYGNTFTPNDSLDSFSFGPVVEKEISYLPVCVYKGSKTGILFVIKYPKKKLGN